MQCTDNRPPLLHSWIMFFIIISCFFPTSGAGAPAEDPLRPLIDAVDSTLAADAPAVIVFDSTRTEVEETGLGHVHRHVLVKILDEEGATRYSSLRFDYDPASNAVEVKNLTVHRKDGSLDVLPTGTLRDLPQPQFMIYWGARMKLAEVPGLEPGDAVEYSTYMKGFTIAYLDSAQGPSSVPVTGTASTPLTGEDDSRFIPPMRGHFYDVVLFESDIPIVEKVYTLVLARDKPVQSMVYNGELSSRTRFDDDRLTYTWWKKNVPGYSHEERMVAENDALTKLVLATVPDWKEKSRWFWQVNEPQFGWNEDIEAKVREVTKGLDSDDEKREALLRWVARQIRYSGITMGEGEGYTLHSGEMTFEDRAGVCKDIAGMLVTMFRAAGYTTYPAMTMAGARVEDIPADQFNHCVVAVKLDDGTYKLYDPTWCPFSKETWSSAEQLQNYVIGSPEGEDLAITDYVPPEDNAVRLRAREKLFANGDLEGELVVTGSGYSETNLRWGVVNEVKRSLRANFERWLAKASPLAEVTHLDTTDPIDLDTPFEIRIGYRIPSCASAGDGDIVFTPVLARYIIENRRLNDYRSATEGDERTYDVGLRCTRHFDMREEVELPRGYVLARVPELATEEGAAASFDANVETRNGKLIFREDLRIKKKTIPKNEYGNFKKAVDLMKELEELPLLLSRKEG